MKAAYLGGTRGYQSTFTGLGTDGRGPIAADALAALAPSWPVVVPGFPLSP